MKFLLTIVMSSMLFGCEALRLLDEGSEPAAAQKGPAITQVSKTVYRLAKPENAVWDSAVNVLMKNYNLNVVDRQSGVISTEWDSFFSNNLTLRNKVSVHIRKISARMTELSVHNSTEKLADASSVGAGGGAVWLPADDSGAEVKRIVHNTALALNLNPPAQDKIEDIAKSDGLKPEPQKTHKNDESEVEESDLNQL